MYAVCEFGSKVRSRTFGCIAMGSSVCLFGGSDCSYILQGLELFCLDLVLNYLGFVQGKILYMYGCMYFSAALVLVSVDVRVMSPV